uniref:serine/threonine-protein phosphatase 7 long form homolog n=1 Tax=Erigeron canadensis TaxID=72917 RepID=UPI001CB961E9|nr:serine/threonine-protein phosphatase 7 long form homolog [Erigeron canadensis]
MASLNVTCAPRNPYLLWLQAQDMRRSYNIFHERVVSEPRCRKGDGRLSDAMKNSMPAKVIQHLKDVGFFQIFKVVVQKLDHPLITMLVERWRPETNTFHFSIGEATVTLQDVQVIWGLLIYGPTVTGEWVTETRNVDYWNNMCMEYLGFFPIDVADFDNLKTVGSNFTPYCLYKARKIILAIIGSEIFLDANTYDVSLNFCRNLRDLRKEGRKSWGIAVLACLYRNLSKGSMPARKGIDGSLLLLQGVGKKATDCPTRHDTQRRRAICLSPPLRKQVEWRLNIFAMHFFTYNDSVANFSYFF